MTDPKLEPKYRTVCVALEDDPDNPLVVLDTEDGRRLLFDTIAAGDPVDARWVVWRGDDLTWGEHAALAEHVGW